MSYYSLFYLLTMYLSVYSPVTKQPQQPGLGRINHLAADSFDFVTPDGVVVPRALGEAALQGRTAVLIGGLLVGVWPKSA
jgi:hypothetical protein